MDVFRSCTNYSIPAYFKDLANDMKNIEAEANQALSNIRSLYEEIMQPEHPDEYGSDGTAESSDPPSSPTLKIKKPCEMDPKKFPVRSNLPYFDSTSILAHCPKCCRQNVEESAYNSDKPYTVETQQLNNVKHQSVPKNNLIKQANVSKVSPKVTVPQPFTLSGFDERRIEAKQVKLAKLKNELELQEEKELNVKVTSKPVPKHTYLPLFNEMLKKDEKRKLERKNKCLEVIGKNESSQLIAKPPSDSNNEFKNLFKATEIPKSILSDKVSEKLKSKEEIRKLLMAHRAEEMLKKSSSPLSKKSVSRSYSILNMDHYRKGSLLDKNSKPNISAITDRLYTKKCKETIESWNDKVMQYNQKENDDSFKNASCKVKPPPEEIFPFLYYPVRMSTATSLRDKQIRAEIEAREKREQQKQDNKEIAEFQQNIHEEISKKLQKLIPVIDNEREIEEKMLSLKESQVIREIEYEKDLKEILKRVSQQELLIERVSKVKQINFREDTIPEESTGENTPVSAEEASDSAHNELLSEPEEFEELDTYSEQKPSEELDTDPEQKQSEELDTYSEQKQSEELDTDPEQKQSEELDTYSEQKQLESEEIDISSPQKQSESEELDISAPQKQSESKELDISPPQEQSEE